jgi:hypothetical protein
MRRPRPNRYRTNWAGELRADDVGEQVRVAGWVHRRRDHGGLIFIDSATGPGCSSSYSGPRRRRRRTPRPGSSAART